MTKNTQLHTPTPWHTHYIEGEDESAGDEWVEICADGEEVAVLMIRNANKWREQMQPQRLANATLIVTAVNAHHALVDSLTECVDILDEACDCGECGPCTIHAPKARAALKLAKG